MRAALPVDYLNEFVDQNRYTRPKFTTVQAADGTVTTTVEIWDGRKFTSDPFPTRVDAEQAAASQVLYYVYGFDKPRPPPPVQIAPDGTLPVIRPSPNPKSKSSTQKAQPLQAQKPLPNATPKQSPATHSSAVTTTLTTDNKQPEDISQEKSEHPVVINGPQNSDSDTKSNVDTTPLTPLTITINNTPRPLNTAIVLQRPNRTITVTKRPAGMMSGGDDSNDTVTQANKIVKYISHGAVENARANTFLLTCDAFLQTEEWKGEKLFRKVDKNSINELPLLKFEGRIRVVATPEDVDNAVEMLCDEPILGLDTESRPAFEKGTRYPTSLIQLATEDTAYLFPLFAFLGPSGKPVIPAGLCSLLSNPKILKVGAGITEDMTKLAHQQHNNLLKPEGIVDLTHLARRCGIQELGLRGLCALLLGHKLSKTEQLSRWDAVVLSPKQQHYAACDAWVGFRLYEELVKRDIPALEKAQLERQKRRAQVLKEFLASPFGHPAADMTAQLLSSSSVESS